MNWIVCNSLPKLHLQKSPRTTRSELFTDSACSVAAGIVFRSGELSRSAVIATEGSKHPVETAGVGSCGALPPQDCLRRQFHNRHFRSGAGCHSRARNAPPQNQQSYRRGCRNPARAIRRGRVTLPLKSWSPADSPLCATTVVPSCKHAQDGPIGHRAQRPLPVIVVRRPAERNQLDGLEQRGQRDIHH